MNKYENRGVSSKKKDVHDALKDRIDKGIFPNAFCKITEDFLGNDNDYCNIMHADGAGTKSSLAYLYYRETQDIDVFKGIVMDAIVMNVDDLLCIGSTNNFLLSNTIGRNSKHIPGEIIKIIIHEFQRITEWFNEMGIKMILTGGETADVGDLVRTLIIDSTITTRLKKTDVITNDKIKPGLVIVGLSSSGQSSYEDSYNSGMGSNGLTSARHDLFCKEYALKYPESFNPFIPGQLAYSGPYRVTDIDKRLPVNLGKAVLSPTRTFAPVIKTMLEEYRDKICGIIHCTGGGQTKCLNFGNNVHYIKNKLFDIPPVFKLIKETSKTSLREMYQVFNMGHRMEIYLDEKYSGDIIKIANSYKVDAKIIGEIKATGEIKPSIGNKNKLTIGTDEGNIDYS